MSVLSMPPSDKVMSRGKSDKPPLRKKPRPPLAPDSSRDAKRWASAVLEVLGGTRTPTDAAQAMNVSLMRYYVMEERALQGLVKACEPRPKGRSLDGASHRAKLERECERLRHECDRQQALVRVMQRAIGLTASPPVPVKTKGKKHRQRKPVVRALQARDRLQVVVEPAASS